MNHFFTNTHTVNEIKSEYRRLCFIHHPDIGGETATMQKVNAEYHEALSRSHGQTSKGTDGKEHTYYYNQDIEQAIMDKINELISLDLPNIEIMLVGTWIWVSGDTRPVKDQLKAIKMKWHSKRKRWFFHTKSYRRQYNANASFDDLCQVYGAKSFDSQKDEQQPVAALA